MKESCSVTASRACTMVGSRIHPGSAHSTLAAGPAQPLCSALGHVVSPFRYITEWLWFNRLKQKPRYYRVAMVEVVGIEPTSLGRSGTASTCLAYYLDLAREFTNTQVPSHTSHMCSRVSLRGIGKRQPAECRL